MNNMCFVVSCKMLGGELVISDGEQYVFHSEM